jgi:2-amino-4-hydroxy-6-hydroxymethyldihydropteridine diphosphokinase
MPPSTTDPSATVPIRAYIGLGANLGDAMGALRSALSCIGRLAQTELLATSPFYRSAPVDAGGPDYTNAVAAIATYLDAHELLDRLQGIEAEHGRERPFVNAPRSLDLDLLLYGEQVISSKRLCVPHPRMHQRAFVLRPLADLAPHLHVPGQGPVGQLLAALTDQSIEPLAP